ncbi:MAG: hypothetical protein CMH83_01605 [Nocardioides sp.]|nr:hypothetical protein [Nocardioides sp.]
MTSFLLLALLAAGIGPGLAALLRSRGEEPLQDLADALAGATDLGTRYRVLVLVDQQGLPSSLCVEWVRHHGAPMLLAALEAGVDEATLHHHARDLRGLDVDSVLLSAELRRGVDPLPPGAARTVLVREGRQHAEAGAHVWGPHPEQHDAVVEVDTEPVPDPGDLPDPMSADDVMTLLRALSTLRRAGDLGDLGLDGGRDAA